MSLVVNNTTVTDTKVKNFLPSGYTLLNYITVPSGAYLNTNYTPKLTDNVEISYRLSTTSGNQCLFCARGSTTTTYTLSLFHIGSQWRYDYWNTIGTSSGTAATQTTFYITAKANECVNEATLIQHHSLSSSFSAGSKMILFASWTGGSNITDFANGLICYSFKIWDNSGTLKRNLVPAKNSSNVAGMYDTVNGVFYSSASATAFTAGSTNTSGISVDLVKASTSMEVNLALSNDDTLIDANDNILTTIDETQTTDTYVYAKSYSVTRITSYSEEVTNWHYERISSLYDTGTSSGTGGFTGYYGDVYKLTPLYNINVTKNTGVSSISLTYKDVNNTSQTISVTSSGTTTVDALSQSQYSWTATPEQYYEMINSSGSGTVPYNVADEYLTQFTLVNNYYVALPKTHTYVNVRPQARHAPVTIKFTKNTGITSITVTYIPYMDDTTIITETLSTNGATVTAQQGEIYSWTTTATSGYVVTANGSGSATAESSTITISPTATQFKAPIVYAAINRIDQDSKVYHVWTVKNPNSFQVKFKYYTSKSSSTLKTATIAANSSADVTGTKYNINSSGITNAKNETMNSGYFDYNSTTVNWDGIFTLNTPTVVFVSDGNGVKVTNDWYNPTANAYLDIDYTTSTGDEYSESSTLTSISANGNKTYYVESQSNVASADTWVNMTTSGYYDSDVVYVTY